MAAIERQHSRNQNPPGTENDCEALPPQEEDFNLGWQYLQDDWPMDDRPAILKDEQKVKKMSMGDIERILKAHAIKKKMVKEKTAERGAKDTPPPTKTFKEAQDDCKKVLHEARWQRLPISKPREWWPAKVTARDPIYKGLPWKFLGAQHCLANKSIELAHDRTRPMSLKHFLSENANIASRPKQEFKKLNEAGQVANITDDWWEGAGTLNQIKDGFNNYAALWYFLWPYDASPLIMNRVMTKYNWASVIGDNVKVRISILKDYFNTVLQVNADRAVNEECILNFEEHEDILKNRMQKENLEKLIPTTRKPAPQSSSSKPIPKLNQSGQTGKKQPNKFSKVTLTSSGIPTCHGWNDLNGGTCRNTPNPLTGGCINVQTQREYAHKCSADVPGKPGKICEKAHRLKDH